jgi:ArsR family transcriptional regulator
MVLPVEGRYPVAMADIFDVVADPTRRDILHALLERYVASESAAGDISVGELVTKLGLSQPTVSKHLKVLRDNGLVNVRELGQHRYYSLDATPLEALEDWLIPFLSADFDTTDDASTAVFAPWAGTPLPASFRRAGESLQHPGETGTAVGRAVADATHQARSKLEDAQHEVDRRVISPIRKKLRRD